MENPNNQPKRDSEKVNISEHGKTVFEDMVFTGLISSLHIIGNRGTGKSRLMFVIADQLQKQKNVRTIIFDGSESWIYGFNKIPVFNISDHDITASNLKQSVDMEKYELQNMHLIKLALATHKHLLIRLKSRQISKRGFAIRKIVCYLDALARQAKENYPNHQINQFMTYFIDESQAVFDQRSTNRINCETFLSAYSESRNNGESFIFSSQRQVELAKMVRGKALKVLSTLDFEDVTPYLRRIEKAHNINFATMPKRHWYFEGSTFVSPEFKQSGKPYIVNEELEKEMDGFITNEGNFKPKNS